MALGLAALSQWGAPSGGLFLGLGGTILLGLGIFPVVQVFGATRLLAGRTSGRIITLVFSVIYLLKFPVGTAICVYSFWVLLREQPQPARRAAGAGHPEPARAGASRPSAATTELALAISARRSALAAARSRGVAAAGATSATSSPPQAAHDARIAAPGRPAPTAPARSITAKPASTPTVPRPRPGTTRPS